MILREAPKKSKREPVPKRVFLIAMLFFLIAMLFFLISEALLCLPKKQKEEILVPKHEFKTSP